MVRMVKIQKTLEKHKTSRLVVLKLDLKKELEDSNKDNVSMNKLM